MRLFIAINFNDEIKQLIFDKEILLENKMINGHITAKNNIHLTLVFIGETNRPKDVSDCIEKIEENKFNLLIKGIKFFNRNGKKLYYLDIKPNNYLLKLYEKLYDELTVKGFELEKREFKPHVTLAREVVLSEKVDIENLDYECKIEKISLMESKRINGELKYIEIYSKELK